MKKILRQRAFLTMALAGVLAVALGMLRGGQANESVDAFQAMRIRWEPQFDMVLAGDSRVNQGISPAAMRTVLKDMRIANFGFGHAVFSGEYLEAVENLLDPASASRTIIIGIAPLALAPRHIDDNEFLQHKRKHPAETFESVAFNDFLHFFRPVEFEERRVLRVAGRLDRVKEFRPDGWAATTMNPEKPTIALGFARDHFKNTQVSKEVIDELMDAIRRWREQGIAVYGFLMPTSLAMVKLEAEISGYDENSFSKAFADAGGDWLSFPMHRYHSYDGQHLRMDSARKFSRVLARTLERKSRLR